MTKRFAPIFGYVDVTEEERLDSGLLEKMRKMHGQLLDKLYVLDYKGGCYTEYTYKPASGKEAFTEDKYEGSLDSRSMSNIIDNICNYILSK